MLLAVRAASCDSASALTASRWSEESAKPDHTYFFLRCPNPLQQLLALVDVLLGVAGLRAEVEGGTSTRRWASEASPRSSRRKSALRHHVWCRSGSPPRCIDVDEIPTLYNVYLMKRHQMYRELTRPRSRE